MLSPHELRKDDFSRSIRGYSPEEVDEHINYIIEKYTELYRANDELERKLRTALSQIDTFRNDEQSIRTALINAQKASSAIIDEATEKADSIIEASKNTCGQILSDFDSKIKEKRDTLYKMQRLVELFKKSLFEEYQNHIQKIEKLSFDEENDFTNWTLPDDYFTRTAKTEVEKEVSENIISQPFEIELGKDRASEEDAVSSSKEEIPDNGANGETSASVEEVHAADDAAAASENENIKGPSGTDNTDREDNANISDEQTTESLSATAVASEPANGAPESGSENDKNGVSSDENGEEDEDVFDSVTSDRIHSSTDKQDEHSYSETTHDAPTGEHDGDDIDSDFEKFLSESDTVSDSSDESNPVADDKFAASDVKADGEIGDIDYEDDIDFDSLLENADESAASDDSDTIIASRSNPVSDTGSIKDAIKALNSRLQSDDFDGSESDSDNSDSEDDMSDEEDEFIKLLKNVTASAEKKKSSPKAGGEKPLSKTAEFDLVYNNNKK